MRAPNYQGGGLVNLVAELEQRLSGEAIAPALDRELAERIPNAASYVLVIFDGLGDSQLSHPAAAPLAADRVGAIDAPFPSTTTVSLATIATGMPPATHGLLGYQLWLPEVNSVVNTIKWTTPWGDPVDIDHESFLPGPNLWERLGASGIEVITAQPANFEGTPLSRVLYRGCRFEPWWNEQDAGRVTAELAAPPGRLVLLYVPHVDFAAHVVGQEDPAYDEAMGIAASIWQDLKRHLSGNAVAVATADHGHVDVPTEHRTSIDRADERDRILYGDPRAMFVRGKPFEGVPGATWLGRQEVKSWWGPPDVHASFEDRVPHGVLLADPGRAVLHRHSDTRLIGQHGGTTEEELRIPVLVASGS